MTIFNKFLALFGWSSDFLLINFFFFGKMLKIFYEMFDLEMKKIFSEVLRTHTLTFYYRNWLTYFHTKI